LPGELDEDGELTPFASYAESMVFSPCTDPFEVGTLPLTEPDVDAAELIAKVDTANVENKNME